jgi:hypothetical protein
MSALVQERISTFLGSGLESLLGVEFIGTDPVVVFPSAFIFSTVGLSGGDAVASSS